MSNIFVGVGGKARKVNKIYVGVNGKAREVVKGYVGVNGKARLFYEANKIGTLQETDWATISTISMAGQAAQYWKVGDTKTLTYGGKTYTARIIGFKQDRTNTSGTEKAGITFELTNVLGTVAYENSAGDSVSYIYTDLYTYCNSTVYNGLPTELKEVIQSVYKVCHHSSGISYTRAAMKVFPLSSYELKKTNQIGSNIEHQYTYYANGNSIVKTALGNTTNRAYWTRTMNYYDADEDNLYCFRVSTNGSISDNVSTAFHYTSIAFCV